MAAFGILKPNEFPYKRQYNASHSTRPTTSQAVFHPSLKHNRTAFWGRASGKGGYTQTWPVYQDSHVFSPCCWRRVID